MDPIEISPPSFKEWELKNVFVNSNQSYYEYNKYLKDWYNQQKKADSAILNDTRQKYLNLLQRLQIFFAEEEIEKWYSDINLNNQTELLLAIPFFAKKLKEISLYILKQREELKKVRSITEQDGTDKGFEALLYNYILTAFTKKNYAVGVAGSNFYTQLPDLSSINNKLQIEIEELYDSQTYFDHSPDVATTEYFDLTSSTLIDFLSSNSLSATDADWIYSIGNVDYAKDSAFDESYIHTETNNLLAVRDIKDQKYLGDSLQQLSIIKQTAANSSLYTFLTTNLQVTPGSSLFYWTSSLTDKNIPLDITNASIGINDSSFISISSSETDFINADKIFKVTDTGVEGAWLQNISSRKVNTSMSVNLLPGKTTIFKFPYPGYGIEGEGLDWTGPSLQENNVLFNTLPQARKKSIYDKYWAFTTPTTAFDPIHIQQLQIPEAAAHPIFEYADKVLIIDKDTNSTSNGLFWYYAPNKTDISIAGGDNYIYWPLGKLNNNKFPINISRDWCSSIALSSLSVKRSDFNSTDDNVFQEATPGLRLEDADIIYKLRHPSDSLENALEVAWLSAKNINEYVTSFTWTVSAPVKSGPKQPSLSLKCEPGTYTPFIWSDDGVYLPNSPVSDSKVWPISAVFTYTDHSSACELLRYNPSTPLSAITNFTPVSASNVIHKKCTCRSIYYTPLGHPGQSYIDFNGNTDFIVRDMPIFNFEDPEAAGTVLPFNIVDWLKTYPALSSIKTADLLALQDRFLPTYLALSGSLPKWQTLTSFITSTVLDISRSFTWFQLTTAATDVGWGPGRWVDYFGNTTSLVLSAGTKYRYFRSNLNKDTTDTENYLPYYVVRSNNLPTRSEATWIKARKNKEGKWTSTNTVSDMVLNAGDVLVYNHKNSYPILEISSTYVEQNTAANVTGTIWSNADYITTGNDVVLAIPAQVPFPLPYNDLQYTNLDQVLYPEITSVDWNIIRTTYHFVNRDFTKISQADNSTAKVNYYQARNLYTGTPTVPNQITSGPSNIRFYEYGDEQYTGELRDYCYGLSNTFGTGTSSIGRFRADKALYGYTLYVELVSALPNNQYTYKRLATVLPKSSSVDFATSINEYSFISDIPSIPTSKVESNFYLPQTISIASNQIIQPEVYTLTNLKDGSTTTYMGSGIIVPVNPQTGGTTNLQFLTGEQAPASQVINNLGTIFSFTPTVSGFFTVNLTAYHSSNSSRDPVIFDGVVPAVTCVPPGKYVDVSYETYLPKANFMLNVPLSGYDICLKGSSLTAPFGKPYWANTKYNNGLVFANEYIKFVDDYNIQTQPTPADFFLKQDAEVQYTNEGFDIINWVQPLTYNFRINSNQWNKIVVNPRTTVPITTNTNLARYINETVDMQPTEIPSSLVLEQYANGSMAKYIYYTTQQNIIPISVTAVNLAYKGILDTFNFNNSAISIKPLMPFANLSNRHYPTIATLPYIPALKSTRETGGLFTYKKLGALTYADNFIKTSYVSTTTSDSLTAFFNTTSYGLPDRGLTKTTQNTPLQFDTAESGWLKAFSLTERTLGDTTVSKRYPKFIGYQSKEETTLLSDNGLVNLNTKLDPWKGSTDSTWDDNINYPPDFRGVLNVDDWKNNQIANYSDYKLYKWRTDVFGNQYGLYKQLSGVPLFSQKTLPGNLWIKTQYKKTKPANVALSAIYYNYQNLSFYNNLSSNQILDIDIFGDNLLLVTDTAAIFAKINYDYETDAFVGTVDESSYYSYNDEKGYLLIEKNYTPTGILLQNTDYPTIYLDSIRFYDETQTKYFDTPSFWTFDTSTPVNIDSIKVNTTNEGPVIFSWGDGTEDEALSNSTDVHNGFNYNSLTLTTLASSSHTFTIPILENYVTAQTLLTGMFIDTKLNLPYTVAWGDGMVDVVQPSSGLLSHYFNFTIICNTIQPHLLKKGSQFELFRTRTTPNHNGVQSVASIINSNTFAITGVDLGENVEYTRDYYDDKGYLIGLTPVPKYDQAYSKNAILHMFNNYYFIDTWLLPKENKVLVGYYFPKPGNFYIDSVIPIIYEFDASSFEYKKVFPITEEQTKIFDQLNGLGISKITSANFSYNTSNDTAVISIIVDTTPKLTEPRRPFQQVTSKTIVGVLINMYVQKSPEFNIKDIEVIYPDENVTLLQESGGYIFQETYLNDFYDDQVFESSHFIEVDD